MATCRFSYSLGDAIVARQTPLFRLHQELGARMVDFGGWDMPVQYSSQIGEHHAVRRAADADRTDAHLHRRTTLNAHGSLIRAYREWW